MPLSVFMKSVRNFIKTPFACLRIPPTESQRNTIVLQRPPGVSRKGDRLELMSFFDFRSTAKFFEKSLIRCVNPSQLLLNRLTRQSVPMRVSRPFQIGKVCGHGVIVGIPQPVFIALTLPLMEIRMHLPHIVKHVTNADCIRLTAELILIGFHGISSTKSLTPFQWMGPTQNLAILLKLSVQLDISIKPYFTKNVKCFFKKTLWSFPRGRCLHPAT